MAEEYGYGLKIPKERVAVLIGKNGETKKQIEEETKTKIEVDSKEGEVFIHGKDALNLFSAREVVKSIARGFNPEIALLLLKGDYCFDMINLSDYTKDKSDITRIKGRIIGREGKSRRTIEDLTETHISVYGKTISIIGLPEDVANARKAIENLVKGASHSNVYKWLEKRRRESKAKEMI
jgi:ribosomal RNA assembly protein